MRAKNSREFAGWKMKVKAKQAREYIDSLRGDMGLDDLAKGAGCSKRTLEKWVSGTTLEGSARIFIQCLIYLNESKDAAEQKAEELRFEELVEVSPFKPLNDEKASDHQPRLVGASGGSHISHYSRRTLDVIGRDDEQEKLLRFIKSDAPFSWMQIAGEGGQGKSRLGYELIRDREALAWKAGFLSEDHLKLFKDKWHEWQPDKPYLFVIDYLVARGDVVGPMFRMLLSRTAELRHPVRLLFLERQRWDRSISLDISAKFSNDPAPEQKLSAGTGGHADWFKDLFEKSGGEPSDLYECAFEKTGMIELKELDDDGLFSVVKGIAEREGGTLSLDEDQVMERLKHFDPSGRPLYAYFLGEALQGGADVSTWNREDLLDYVLGREQSQRWQAEAGSDAEKLAVLATMVEGLNWKDCKGIEGVDVSADMRRKALSITHAPVEGVRNLPDIIPSLQPDVLGEWFVINALNEDLDVAEMAELAWELDPLGMVRFLERLVHDFPAKSVAFELAAFKPDTDESCAYYDYFAISLLIAFDEAGKDIPNEIVLGLRRRAKAGDVGAMFNLGQCYFKGAGVSINHEDGVSWYRKAAEAGDVKGMYNLGHCYGHGTGVSVNHEEAVSWYRKAAEAGDANAMMNLGVCYRQGNGVMVSHEEAVIWFYKAAEAGNAQAMHNLGHCYGNGTGVAVNHKESVSWYRKASEAGVAKSMFNLALCYRRGDGVLINQEEAVSWYHKAAGMGHAAAMCNLGVCYGQGDGVSVNQEEAMSWYRKAAEAEDAKATYNLGARCWRGIGVEEDANQAIYWFTKAAKLGSEEAIAALKEINRPQQTP